MVEHYDTIPVMGTIGLMNFQCPHDVRLRMLAVKIRVALMRPFVRLYS